MTTVQSILLGALQGLTEFLPVSSSGHLILLRELMNIDDPPPLFDILLHLATLIAVVIVLRAPLLQLVTATGRFILRRSRPEDGDHLKLVVALIVATGATAILGGAFLLLDMEPSPTAVSLLLLVTAGILILSRKPLYKSPGRSITALKALSIGVAQGAGVLPGISRSGITISTAVMLGVERSRAGEFAFLISIPAILGAMIVKMDEFGSLTAELSLWGVIAGFATAGVVGFCSLKLLLITLRRGRLHLFALYLIPAGVAGLLFL